MGNPNNYFDCLALIAHNRCYTAEPRLSRGKCGSIFTAGEIRGARQNPRGFELRICLKNKGLNKIKKRTIFIKKYL